MSSSKSEAPVVEESPGPVGEAAEALELELIGHQKVADFLRNNGVPQKAVDVILENEIDSNVLDALNEEDLVDLNMTKAHAKWVAKLKPQICVRNQAAPPESLPR